MCASPALRYSAAPSFPLHVLFAVLFLVCPAAAHQQPLRIAVNTMDPNTLDPVMHYNTTVNSVLRQVYGTLIDKSLNGELIPSLATSWRQVEPTVWEINLREGVLFHNGREMTSEDVVYSLNRLFDPELKSPRKSNFASIKKVEPSGKHSVRITTHVPDLMIPQKLFVFGGVVNASDLQKHGTANYFKHPVGAGPFRLYSLSSKEMVLKPFPAYWKGAPKVESVSIQFVVDPEQALERLLAEQIDILTELPHKAASSIEKSGKIDLISQCTSQVFEIFFDASPGALFSNKKLRIAMNYLTPIGELFTEADRECRVPPGTGSSFARRIPTFTTPHELGFDPRLSPYPHDPETGKKLLAESGFPDGFTMNLLTLNVLEDQARLLASHWEQYGIKSKITVMDRERAFRKVLIERSPDVPFDAMLTNPLNHWGDAVFLMELHVSPEHPICRYDNPAAVELLKRAAAAGSIPERDGILQQLQRMIYDDPPAVFGYQYICLFGVNRRVRGFMPHPDLYLRLDQVEIRE